MTLNLTNLIFLAGLLQLSILCAAFVVPFHLDWKSALAPLPKLIRQLFWTYSGYTVISIIAYGIICLLAHEELATTRLGRIMCVYLAFFWTIRLLLQLVFEVKPYMTNAIVIAGDVILTIIFLALTIIFILGATRAIS